MQVKDKICVQIAETEGHTLRLFFKNFFIISYFWVVIEDKFSLIT